MEFNPVLTVHLPKIVGNNVVCTYEHAGITYQNSYTFPQPISPTMQSSRLLRWLALTTSLGMFSLEYFSQITCNFFLAKAEIDFFEKLLYQGLGEFRFVNHIPINTTTKIITAEGSDLPDDKPTSNEPTNPNQKILLLNGGGKDGSTSGFLLEQNGFDFTWFQRGNSVAQSSVVNAWDKPVFIVNRELDKRRKGKYSGHRPMSAGIAVLALFAAEAFGYKYVIASNETSANEGNMTIDGFTVNHQYSKSISFEKDLQSLLTEFNIRPVYFSLLRSLNELQIAKIFSNLQDAQLQAITSCNNGTRTGKWCLACAKCAFVALALTAINPGVADTVLGENAINHPELTHYIEALVNPSIDKPLECVGTLSECQVALALISKHNPKIKLSPELVKLCLNFKATDGSIDKTMRMREANVVPRHFQPIIKYLEKSFTNF